MTDDQWLTYREAARRVRRALITVKRWRRNGMPMSTDSHGRRIVREDVLFDWFRSCLMADPVHQARIRAAAARRTQHEGSTDE